MPRRVNLPGASELFRVTDAERTDGLAAVAPGTPGEDQPTRNTGRVRHDEKITVYVSADELLALEQARLRLRAEHGLAVDRGRIVRAAVAGALQDLAEQGKDSDLLRRLADT